MKTWFVTGVSRGLGLAIAKAALARGDRVIGTVRAESPTLLFDEGKFHLIRLDVENASAVDIAIREAFSWAGTIDVVVNNAGYGLLGSVEQSTDEELEKLFGVNVFGPIRITRSAIPYLRRQGSGHIIFITSIAGRAPSVGAALYSSAKHAIEGFAASLSAELAPLKIYVTAIAPGQFRTEFLSATSIQKSDAADPAYRETVGKTMSTLGRADHKQPGDPEKAARVIMELGKTASPPLHLLLGSDALSRAGAKIDQVVEEMKIWCEWTRSTDFE